MALYLLEAYLAIGATNVFGQPVTFDVTSIKKSVSGTLPLAGANANNRGFVVNPTAFAVRRATLKLLIGNAYNLEDYQILGGENWMQTERFDVDAKAAAPSTNQQMNQMLQALLRDRFALKFHRASNDLDAYVLSVAKGGPKLGPAFQSVDATEPPATVERVVKQIPFPSVTMATFARYLRLNLSHDLATGTTTDPADVPPVLDKTGLEGTYFILLNTTNESDWSRLLERQVGLKVELHKVPIETLVIDSAARPDPN